MAFLVQFGLNCVYAQHPDAVFPIPQNYSGTDYQHINLYTGDLNYSHTITTFSGRNLSYTLDILYNSRSSEINFNNPESFEPTVLGGYGWKMMDYPKIVKDKNTYYLLDGYRSYPLNLIAGTTNTYTAGYSKYLWKIVRSGNGSNSDNWQIIKENGDSYIFDKNGVVGNHTQWNISKMAQSQWTDTLYFDYDGNTLNSISNLIKDTVVFHYNTTGDEQLLVRLDHNHKRTILKYENYRFKGSTYPLLTEIQTQHQIAPDIYDEMTSSMDFSYIEETGLTTNTGALDSMIHSNGAIMAYLYKQHSIASDTYFSTVQVAHNNGYNNSSGNIIDPNTYTYLEYDISNARVDSTGIYAQYNQSTVFPGGRVSANHEERHPYGNIEYYYLNGQPSNLLENLPSNYNASIVGNAVLRGAPYLSKINSDSLVHINDKEGSSEVQYWDVGLVPGTSNAGNESRFYPQLVKSITTTYNVANTTTNIYDQDIAMLTETHTSRSNPQPATSGQNQRDSVKILYTYAFQQYPELGPANLHILSPIARTIEVVLHNTTTTWDTTLCDVVQWTQWDSEGQPGTNGKWAEWKKYKMASASSSTNEAFDLHLSSREWQLDKEILVRTADGDEGGMVGADSIRHYFTYTTSGYPSHPIANFTNTNPYTGQSFYRGFEPYEQFIPDAPKNRLYDSSAHSGKYALNVVHFDASVILEPKTEQYICSFWYMTDDLIPTIVSVQIQTGVILTKVLDPTFGEWKYIDLLTDSLSSTISGDTATVNIDHGGSKLYIDDIRFGPAILPFSATVYSTEARQVSALIDNNGGTDVTVPDRFGKNVLEVGPDSTRKVKTLSFYYDSRKGNTLFGNSDLFNPNYPNSDITVFSVGPSYWDGFNYTPSSYFPTSNLHNMEIVDGLLKNTGTVSNPGTAISSIQIQSNDFVVFVEAIGNDLGSGEELGITFSTSSVPQETVRFVLTPVSFKLYKPSGNVVLRSIACSTIPNSSSLFLEIINQNHLFAYADGRFLFDYKFQENLTGPIGLISTNENSYFDNFVLVNDPWVSMNTYDAGDKQKQKLIRSTSTQLHTVAHLYGGEMDLLGASTRHAFVDNTDTHQTSGLGLTYMADFAKYDAKNQKVDTSSIVAKLYGYDNPYESSQTYFNSPLLNIQSSGSGGEFAADSMGTDYTYTGGALTSVGIDDGTLVMNQVTNPDKLQTTEAVNHENTLFARVQNYAGDTISSQYEHDPFMRLEKEYQPNFFPDGENNPNFFTGNTYDFVGNKTAISDPDKGQFHFVYSPDNLLFFAIDSTGLSLSPNVIQYFIYDHLNRLVEQGYYRESWNEDDMQHYADSNTYPPWNPTWSKKWEYDGNQLSPDLGHLTKASTNNDSDNIADVIDWMKYDLEGNQVQASTQVPAFNNSVYVFDFKYNNANQITNITSGTSYDVTYTYNNFGKISGVGTSDNPTYYASFEYQDTIITATLNNGQIQRIYDLNPAGWIDNITDPFFSDSLTYTKGGVDGAGYFSGSIASATSGFNWVNAPAAYTYKYKYDGFGRLIAGYVVETDQNDLNYATYDDNGNLKILQRWKDKTIFWNDEKSNKQAIQTAYIGNLATPASVNQESYVIHGMDIDPLTRKVYWVDQSFKTQVVNFDGSDQITLPLTLPIYPDGIALDLVNRNIYYAIPFMGYVIKADFDGTHSEIIARDNHPQDIVVYPKANQLLWPDGTAPDHISIKSSDLNGDNIKTLISFPAGSPTVLDIALDTMRKRIYWCTSTSIQSANLDGSDITNVYSEGSGIRRISLDIFNKEVFWSDANSIQLIRFDGTNQSTVLSNLANPEWIYQNLRNNIYTYESGTNKVVGTEGTIDQFTYDASGNVIRNAKNGIDSLVYDNITNLTTAVYKDSDTSIYAYNYLNLRSFTKSGDTRKINLYGNNNSPLVQLNDSGNGSVSEIQYVYGPFGLIAIKYQGAHYYVLKDHLGSIRVVVNENGNVEGWYNYSPFGSLMTDISQPVNPATVPVNYLYTGQEFDSELKVYNYKARLYDPDLGRFYSTDPLIQYSSPYSYAGNDPVSNIDPSGTWGWKSILGVIGGSALVVAGAVTFQPEFVIGGLFIAGASTIAGAHSSISTSTPGLIGASGNTYITKTMDKHYRGEEKPGNSIWPGSQVKYLNSAERAQYELFVQAGKLVDKNGNLYDTKSASSAFSGGRAIFVMGKTGRIFANKSHSVGKFHHSSFLAGQPVGAAGEIKVDNGEIKLISNKSGHYKPSKMYIDQFLKELKTRGIPSTNKITLDII